MKISTNFLLFLLLPLATLVSTTFGLVALFAACAVYAQPSTAQTENRNRLIATNSCVACDLRGVSLVGQNLLGADLREADLSRADLRGAFLIGANLSKARLVGINLSGAVIGGTVMSGADMKGSNLPLGPFRGQSTLQEVAEQSVVPVAGLIGI